MLTIRQRDGTVTGRRTARKGLVEDAPFLPSVEDAPRKTPACQEGASGEGLGKIQAGHKPMQRLKLVGLRDKKKTGMAGVSRASW